MKKTPNEWIEEGRKKGWGYRINLWRFPFKDRSKIMSERKMIHKEFNDTIAY